MQSDRTRHQTSDLLFAAPSPAQAAFTFASLAGGNRVGATADCNSPRPARNFSRGERTALAIVVFALLAFVLSAPLWAQEPQPRVTTQFHTAPVELRSMDSAAAAEEASARDEGIDAADRFGRKSVGVAILLGISLVVGVFAVLGWAVHPAPEGGLDLLVIAATAASLLAAPCSLLA